MKRALSAILFSTVFSNLISPSQASENFAKRIAAAELEKNAVAYKGQRISVNEMVCQYVQGVYLCVHRTAKLIVIASNRPQSFQEYVERGCGIAGSDMDRCTVETSFRIDNVKWEAQPGQVRTAIVASDLDITLLYARSTREDSPLSSDGVLPIRANEFADVFNSVANRFGQGDLKASLTTCERGEKSTLCRYRIGEHSVLTMVAAGASNKSNELALTSTIDTIARQQMVKSSMNLIVEMIAPSEYPEVRVEALSALLRKADEAQRNSRRAQLVTQNLGLFELLLYQDLQGYVNFNVRKKQ